MKRIFILILTLFMSLSIVSAALDDSQAYYAFDNSSGSFNDSSGNGNSLTNQGTINISGVLQDARNFNGTNEWIDTSLDFSSYSNYAFNVWVALDTPATGQEIIISNNFGGSSTGDFEFKAVGPSANKMQVFLRDGTNLVLESNTTVTDNNYHMYTYVKNGNNHSIYLDGSLVDSDTSTNTINNKIPDIGRNPAGSSYLEGSLDEFAIYNRSLSQSEILELYNNGDGFNPYSISGTTITFNNPTEGQFLNSLNFTLNVSFSEITNSTYILNGGNETVLGTNVNESTANLTGIEGVNNITVFTNTSGVEGNSSISFTLDTTPPEIDTNFTGEYNFFDIDFTQFINVTDNISLAFCTIDFSNSLSSNCNNTVYTFDFSGNQSFNITAEDQAGNSVKLVNNTLLVNPYATFLFNQSNSSFIEDYIFGGRADVNGTVQYNYYNDGLIIGENTLLFEKLGFASTNITFTINDTPTAFNQTYQIQNSKIVITIYDRDNNQVLTGLTEIELIASQGFIGNTTTGFLNISDINFISEQYQLLVNHAGYATENLFFDYNNQEILPVDVYLLNSNDTNFGITTVRVTAESGLFIRDALCTLKEWRSDLSSFISVAQGISDVDGQVTFNVELNEKVYKVLCSYQNFIAEQLLGNGGVISVSGLVTPIYLTSTTTPFSYRFEDVLFDFTNSTETNITQRLTFEWSDSNNIVAQGCVKTYRSTGFNKELLTQTCTATSSGEIQIIVNINNSYDLIAEASFIDSNDIETLMASITFPSTENLEGIIQKYHLDLVIPIILFFIGVAAGLVLDPQNFYISLIAVFILEWISFLIVPSVLSFGVVTFISVIIGFLMWGIYSGRR